MISGARAGMRCNIFAETRSIRAELRAFLEGWRSVDLPQLDGSD